MERQKNPLILRLTILSLLMGSAIELSGQSIVTQAPDCYRSFAFTATGNGPTLANYGPGTPDGGAACTVWQLSYAVSSTGVVTSLSLVVQSAPAATYTTPGTYVTYAGTVDTGINPNTSITGAQTAMHNGAVAVPFIRVALTALSATGTTTVFGLLQGWSEGNGSGGGGGTPCPGTTGTPCVVVGPTASGSPPTTSPVLVAGTDGTNTQTVKTDNQGRLLNGAYPTSAPLTVTASGLTQIIAASGSTVITLGSISMSFASAVDWQLEQGTGANCGTGTTAVTGLYKSILAVALDNPIEIPAGKALCVNLGTAVTGGGLAMYNQQ